MLMKKIMNVHVNLLSSRNLMALGEDSVIYKEETASSDNSYHKCWKVYQNFEFDHKEKNKPSVFIDWYSDKYDHYALGDNGVLYELKLHKWKYLCLPVDKDGKSVIPSKIIDNKTVVTNSGDVFCMETTFVGEVYAKYWKKDSFQ